MNNLWTISVLLIVEEKLNLVSNDMVNVVLDLNCIRIKYMFGDN